MDKTGEKLLKKKCVSYDYNSLKRLIIFRSIKAVSQWLKAAHVLDIKAQSHKVYYNGSFLI